MKKKVHINKSNNVPYFFVCYSLNKLLFVYPIFLIWLRVDILIDDNSRIGISLFKKIESLQFLELMETSFPLDID